MNWFHRHKYKLEAVTYAPPTMSGDVKVTGANSDVLEVLHRARVGTTTFVYRCVDATCCHLKTVVALGKRVVEERS